MGGTKSACDPPKNTDAIKPRIDTDTSNTETALNAH